MLDKNKRYRCREQYDDNWWVDVYRDYDEIIELANRGLCEFKQHCKNIEINIYNRSISKENQKHFYNEFQKYLRDDKLKLL